MNKSKFIELIRDPSKVSSSDMEKLQDLIDNFPYCQSAHILMAKLTNDTGNMLAKKKLAVAAAYTADRKNLKLVILQQPGEPLLHKEVPQQMEEVSTKLSVIPEEQSEEKEETIAKAGEEIKEKKQSAEISDEKEKFFLELHENLLKLRQLKNFAAHLNEQKAEKEEKEIKDLEGIQEPVVIPPAPEEEDRTQYEKDEASGPHIFIHDINKSIIQASRMEEVLIDRDIEGRLHHEPVDFMIDYLTYLDTERNNFMKDKTKMEALIDKFIRENPGMPPVIKLPAEQQDLAAESIKLSKIPISENFAQILTSQGRYKKAIYVYEQLILKFPEKKANFEAQIETIKYKI